MVGTGTSVLECKCEPMEETTSALEGHRKGLQGQEGTMNPLQLEPKSSVVLFSS